jgi:hypothetical protein
MVSVVSLDREFLSTLLNSVQSAPANVNAYVADFAKFTCCPPLAAMLNCNAGVLCDVSEPSLEFHTLA